eukprot:Blabericola_migrator_1__8414@NODE_4384_length_1188_cov_14_920607_g2713_i0_p1_GENE_NODE_4384_length_1188_cov_14_920607_g2713_i0NODE_4384_length_1188_cov_14_920607_g2713_i0_p1_ORF_typecomplete_len239_score43_86_NODE_4384_length_1188_cov_14_920607_g2713_i04711187
MTCPKSVFPRKSSERQDAEFNFKILAAIIPCLSGVPNTVDVHSHSNTVREQPKERYDLLVQHFDTPELSPYLKAAVKAATKEVVSMSTQPSTQAESSDLVSILVECLKGELETADLSSDSREAAKAVLSDEGRLSSVGEWAQSLMSNNWGPALSLSGLLNALPLASGAPAPRGNEVLFGTEDAIHENSLHSAAQSVGDLIKTYPYHALICAGLYSAVCYQAYQLVKRRYAQRRTLRKT